MACSKKQKHIMKKAIRSSKKDGKGGPFMDTVKGMAHNVGEKVKEFGDKSTGDKVKGIASGMAKLSVSPIAGPLSIAKHVAENPKVRDAASTVSRYASFPARAAAHSFHDEIGAIRHAVGEEWAKTRGEGEKKGLLKEAVRKAKPAVMPNLTPKSPSIIHKPGQPSPFGGRLPMKPKQPLQPIKPMLPKNPVRPLRPHRPHRPITPRKRFA